MKTGHLVSRASATDDIAQLCRRSRPEPTWGKRSVRRSQLEPTNAKPTVAACFRPFVARVIGLCRTNRWRRREWALVGPRKAITRR